MKERVQIKKKYKTARGALLHAGLFAVASLGCICGKATETKDKSVRTPSWEQVCTADVCGAPKKISVKGAYSTVRRRKYVKIGSREEASHIV